MLSLATILNTSEILSRAAKSELQFCLNTADGQRRSIGKSLSLAAKAAVRLLVHFPSCSGLWREFGRPKFSALHERNAGIFVKHLRQAYWCGLTSHERARIIAEHYRRTSDQLRPDFLHRSLSDGLVIWKADDDPLGPRIVASAANQYDFESELNFKFMLGDQVLYIMGCIVSPGDIWRLEPQPVLVITRVQGIRTTLPLMKIATEKSGDCAPKLLLFAAIEGLANALKIRRTIGIGVQKQIATAFGKVNTESFWNNYDGFWESLGGQMRPDGNFILPSPIVMRPLTEIKPNHRRRAYSGQNFRRYVTSEVTSYLVP